MDAALAGKDKTTTVRKKIEKPAIASFAFKYIFAPPLSLFSCLSNI